MHTDPELLSLLALGESGGAEDDRLHVQTCPECAAELAQLHRLVSLGRSVSAETILAVPRQEVWVRIRDELHLGPDLEPSTRRPVVLLADPPEPPRAGRSLDGARTRPMDRHGRGSLLGIVRAVAGSGHEFQHEPTAHARLTPVDGLWSHASGEAELATDEHGRRLLQVALRADLPSSGLRQAWLVHRDDPNLRQSLGVLDGPHGLWTVEHSIDLETYAILDISQQRHGETDHSGQTIVRGELTLVS